MILLNCGVFMNNNGAFCAFTIKKGENSLKLRGFDLTPKVRQKFMVMQLIRIGSCIAQDSVLLVLP